jgi:uncharacterized protein YhjY with autotransporter beta-barrel domain
MHARRARCVVFVVLAAGLFGSFAAAEEVTVQGEVTGPVAVDERRNRVEIERGARITGIDGVVSTGDLDAVNRGRINVSGDGIRSFGKGNVWNFGSIQAGDDGIVVFESGYVLNRGEIEGDDGIVFFGRAVVENFGKITAHDQGLVLFEDAIVKNYGSIRGDFQGVVVFGPATFLNGGYVFGDFQSVVLFERSRAYNWGTIEANRAEGLLIFEDAWVENRGRVISHQNDAGNFFGNETWLMNSGSFWGRDNGVVVFGRAYIENSGLLYGAEEAGLETFDLTWLHNSGKIWGRENGAILFDDAWITNRGLIDGLLENGLRLFGTQHDVANYGLIGGREASIRSFGDRLHLSGTGSYRGRVVGEGGTLYLNLAAVPKEAKAALARFGGDVSGRVFSFPGWDFSFEGFDRLVIQGLVSFEEQAQGGLDEFGRALDWTDLLGGGPEADLLAGLSMIPDRDDLNEAFETASGRSLHHLQSDNAFQVATQLSVTTQRYFDRVRERRRHGLHGGHLALTQDSGIASELAAITGRQYASSQGVVVADVIEPPEEAAPPPRRRPEPSPEAPAAPRAEPVPAPPEIAAAEPVMGGFLSGLGLFADQDRTGNRVNSDWTTAGATLGVDRLVGDGLVAGLQLGYFRTEADVDGFGSELEDDVFSLGPYLAWGGESGWHASLSALYSYHRYEQERQVVVPGFSVEAESDPDGHQLTSYLSAGWDWHAGAEGSAWTLGPYAALQHSLLDVGSYDESGAGPLNLQYDDQLAQSLQTHVGLRVNRELSCGWGAFVPELRAAWVHEFMNDDRSITTRTNSLAIPAFDVETEVADRDFGVVGAALTATLSRWHNVHFFAGYDARIGQDDYLAHAASAGLWVQF